MIKYKSNNLYLIKKMDAVIELVFIVGGIILAYIIKEASKLFKVILNEKPISLTHFIFCLISPFVLWQFIYNFTNNLKIAEHKGVDAFGISFLAIAMMTILMILAALIYPPHVDEYTTEDEKFRLHLISSRRIFFSMVPIYILSTGINNIILDINTSKLIWIVRIILGIICIANTILELKKETFNKNTVSVGISYPILRINTNTNGTQFQKSKKHLSLYKFNSENKDNIISNVYNKFDMINAIAVMLGFIIITLIRELS